MKVQLCLVVLAASVALVSGVCKIGLGNRERFETQLYVLHAKKDPVVEPQNMTLVFDYKVSPVDTVELTYVDIEASLKEGCKMSFPANNNLKEGFKVTLTTVIPVTELSGTATIYGIRRGN